jgi:hypothetical protein
MGDDLSVMDGAQHGPSQHKCHQYDCDHRQMTPPRHGQDDEPEKGCDGGPVSVHRTIRGGHGITLPYRDWHRCRASDQ